MTVMADTCKALGVRWTHPVAVALLLAFGPLAAQPPTPPEVSVIQAPLVLDLSPLFAAAEGTLPKQAGHWPGWRDWHGIEARYRAWRGPLALSLRGDVLHAQAHVRYQVEARKGLIGRLRLSAGCGVEEPPRQALIGVLARLDWAPDWSLHPRVRVLPTRFVDRCEVSVADIDVSPLVGRVFEARIEDSLAEALRALDPRLRRLRGEAERAWRALQVPRELTPGLWLHLQPLALALAPLQGMGTEAQTALWLALRAALAADARPTAAPTPLPPLVPYHPTEPGLRFALGLALDYPRLSAALSTRLRGETLDISGRRVAIEALSLATQGADLMLTVELGGDLPGRLTLTARPGFDAPTQTLTLTEVDFVFDAEDPDQGLLANLFHEPIRARIAAAANALLAERTAGLQAALAARLGEALPAQLTADLSGLRIAELAITPETTGLRLSGWAQGSLALRARAP